MRILRTVLACALVPVLFLAITNLAQAEEKSLQPIVTIGGVSYSEIVGAGSGDYNIRNAMYRYLDLARGHGNLLIRVAPQAGLSEDRMIDPTALHEVVTGIGRVEEIYGVHVTSWSQIGRAHV